jgi:Zn-dependent protease
MGDLAYRVLLLIPMVLSLSVHEWAHAWSAYRLGDDTAKRLGRLTLNPIEHIDPLGTIILPLLGVPFGWAKPVPVNPAKFSRGVSMRTGMAITAAAGPISNFVLAILGALALGLWLRMPHEPSRVVQFFLLYMVKLNVSLGLFNLLPVPPLDGSRIASRFLSARFPSFWNTVESYSGYLLMAVMLGGSRLLAGPMAAVDGLLLGIVSKIAYG